MNKPRRQGGFTLIETLVSLTLFTVVLVIAGGTVVSVIDINKSPLGFVFFEILITSELSSLIYD